MRRLLVPTIGGLVLIIVFSARPVSAQIRGGGVGAMAGTTNGSASVTVGNGRTAPWAEVIVETTGEELQAVSEIDAGGAFTFSFTTAPGNIGNLVIYAVDEAGVTAQVPISGDSIYDFILPPTIVGNTTGLPNTSVGVEGFSYPGAVITLTLVSDNGYNSVFSTSAKGITGKWDYQVDDLAEGNYTASAVAAFGTVTSLKSQDLTFTIGGALVPTPTGPGGIIPGIEPITEIITTTTESVVNLTTSIGNTAARVITNLPAGTKKNIDTVTKLLTPIAATSLLWGSGLLNLITSFDYVSTGARLLLGFFIPMKRKKNRWGIVYDAATKQPIARAIVRLYKASGELMETEATGKSGIFSFLTEEGQYEIKVVHPEYRFPSKLITGSDDGEYQSVYHGEFITVSRSSPIVNVSIPMDPKAYSVVPRYNFMKDTVRKMALYSNALLYGAGLSLSVISYFLNPVLYNFIVILFYMISIVYLLRKIVDDRTKWGVVLDVGGVPASGVALSLLDSVFKRLVQRRVTDRYGRYQFVVPEGGYFILISSPEWELKPRVSTYDGGVVSVRKKIGVVKPRVVVRKKERLPGVPDTRGEAS